MIRKRALTALPLADLSAQHDALRPALLDAVRRVVESDRYILGPEVEALEAEVAAFSGTRFAVGVNSGTDALVIALSAAGIGRGDEVITSSFTFFATAEAIEQVGATPVFVDIDPITFNLDPEAVEAAIGSRSRAIVPVHLYGHAADMDSIVHLATRHQLAVIEDAAQSFGGTWRESRLGSLGLAGCYSFFPSKNLGGFGDGGMIVTSDEDLAVTARKLRTHGAARKYHNEMIGYNSRLDELQAAMLRVKLPYVDEWNDRRRAAAARYGDLFVGSSIVCPSDVPPARHVWHQYTIRADTGSRDAHIERLRERSIAWAIYYPRPVHRLPMYDQRLSLPEAERAAEEVLSLPLWPGIPIGDQRRVVEALAA